jgi:8-oxo-dGTP pyrophosphatase MutT (NUDIX family)
MLMGMIGGWLRALLSRGLGGARRRRTDPPGLLAPRFPVGAAVLIRDTEGRILLVQQTYRQSAIWLPPGGWMDRGETPQQAACREAREEVGLHVKVGRPLALGGGGYGELTVLFECQVIGDLTLILSEEIERAAFFHPDALPPMADQTQRWLAEALAVLVTHRGTTLTPRPPLPCEGEGEIG